MGRFDAVLFDAGETLVRPEPSFGEALHALLAERGHVFEAADVNAVAREALWDASQEIMRRGEQWTVSPQSSRAFWTGIYARTLEVLGAPAEPETPHWLFEQFTQPERYGPYPDALPALRELRALGFRLGVVSNWESWLPVVLDRAGMTPLLDVICVSGIEGIEKPDHGLFRIALDRLGVPPERAAYVGDSPTHDVEPALGLGMAAVLLDRHGKHDGIHRPTIASLGMLSAVL